jgi:hypothetical protein
LAALASAWLLARNAALCYAKTLFMLRNRQLSQGSQEDFTFA